jgi:cell division protease FtsH
MFKTKQKNEQDEKRKINNFKNLRNRSGQYPLGCTFRPTIFWIIILIIMIYMIFNVFGRQRNLDTISYTKFRTELTNGNVEQVVITGDQVSGTFRSTIEINVGEDKSIEQKNFITYIPSFGDDSLLPLLEENGVEVSVLPKKNFSFGFVLLNVLPFLILIFLGFMFFRRMRSQGQNVFSMGQSRAKLYSSRQEKTTFEDVAGVRGAKTELKEIVGFLKDPSQFQRLGGKTPKGVLLVGPPGTGKTLLARAVAGEAEVPFFSITGSDFMEMFVGVGASRVRDLFGKAKRQSPSIIFIDELDSIGRRRGAGLGGGHDEREQTLNQLLSEMDGFEPNDNVILMAATNRPDILDPALLRPGRFDRRIAVDMPSMKDRLEILKIHTGNKPLDKDINLEDIARGSPGFSGADLANMLNEAALLAARNGKDHIEMSDFEEARDKMMMGLERENLALTKEECRMIAYHEAGHAVVAASSRYADPIHKVTIVPRGRAMGSTHQLPEGDKYVYPREYIMDRLKVMLGGRAAEHMALNTSTSGAENDLKEVTRIARKMVLDWGMSEEMEHIALGGRREHVFLGEEIAERRDYSEITAREVDEAIKNILHEAFNSALSILKKHSEGLEKVVDALLKKEEISGQEVIKLIGLKS